MTARPVRSRPYVAIPVQAYWSRTGRALTSTRRIALPLLSETLVTDLIGVRGPWPWAFRSYGLAVLAIAVLGPLLILLSTLVLTSTYLKV
jgi:hypothetical protein